MEVRCSHCQADHPPTVRCTQYGAVTSPSATEASAQNHDGPQVFVAPTLRAVPVRTKAASLRSWVPVFALVAVGATLTWQDGAMSLQPPARGSQSAAMQRPSATPTQPEHLRTRLSQEAARSVPGRTVLDACPRLRALAAEAVSARVPLPEAVDRALHDCDGARNSRVNTRTNSSSAP